MMPADFKKLMVARFLFTFAVQMQAIILGWRMYDLTQDPLFLGFVGLAEAIPALGLALFAGYIVDRSRPLKVYSRVVIVSFVSGLILLISQFPIFALSQRDQVIALFASSVLTGMARAFSQPSIFSAVPRIIPREELPRASAWMSSAMQTARISGPALGGLIFGLFGVVASASVICFSLLLAMGAMALIRFSPPANHAGPRRGSAGEELLSGARFVFSHPILLPALTLDMVSVLFGGVTALLPIYAAEILAIGPKGLGLLRAAPAIGAAVTSYWLTTVDIREKAGSWLLGAVTGFGVSILVFAVSRDFWLSLAALALSGAFDSVSMVIRTSAVQLSSPEALRGRISAVNTIFIGSSNELGEFESGLAAKWLGTMPAAVFGGIMCLLTVAVIAIKSPRLRRLNLNELREGAAAG